eukprot:g16412.t1
MDSSTSRSRLGIHAPGLPDSAIALAERLLSAKSPGEVLTLGTKAVEALHTEVDQEQRSLRLGQIALSLQLLARQADGPRKAVILKDRRLAGMVESLKENAEELEVWILAAGSCALGRLASLSLGAAQATGPAHEALLACSQKKLSTFEVAQAALVLASLASVPERLASPVGRQLRESLVSTLELQSQDTRCCGAERWGADCYEINLLNWPKAWRSAWAPACPPCRPSSWPRRRRAWRRCARRRSSSWRRPNRRCAGRFTCAHPVQWSTSPRLCRRAGAGWTPSRTS